jgi:hypothetical protein
MAAAIILFKDTYVSLGAAFLFFSFFMRYRKNSYYRDIGMLHI